MKISIIILCLITFQTGLFSYDIFENNNPKKERVKVTKYTRADGSILKFNKVPSLKNFVEQKNAKPNSIQSGKSNSCPTKFYFQRENKKIYESNDLRTWKPAVNIQTEVQNVTKANLSIKPNPVHNYIELECEGNQKYDVYSFLGIKVLEGTCNSAVDVSSLPVGIYFLRVDNQIIKFFKI